MTAAPPVDDLWRLEIAKARLDSDRPDAPGAAFWPAALIGLAAWFRTVLGVPFADRLDPSDLCLAALHGEVSNRTRHLLLALSAEAPETPLILLGRPRQSMSGLRQAFAGAGLGNPRLIRPYSLVDALKSLPAGLSRLSEGARILREASWRPDRRALAAICFRMLMGETAARWARRQPGAKGRRVIFGHTGIADTDRLERALQSGGARTLHWVHGVSLGLNFVAGSDIGLFQCGADARWHQNLGGYGQTLSLPAKQPEPAPAGDGWLLLSNLAHPMNPDFRRNGTAAEEALLEAVSRAARLRGQTRLVWKPHPVLRTLPQDTQDRLNARARALGFAVWPHPDGELAHAANFALVVASPSTVALDMLRLGVVAVIHGAAAIDPMSALARLPFHTATAEDLAIAAGALCAPAARAEAFAAAWSAVEPGRQPTLAELWDLLSPEADVSR
jgi:hypothetical protein